MNAAADHPADRPVAGAVNGAADDPAAQRQRQFSALCADLHTAPYRHDFFAVLRRIDGLHPQAPRTGRAARPSQEALRLGQSADLDFAPAMLASFGHSTGAGSAALTPRLSVRFFGLLGPQGPMPLHLTETVRERQRLHNDPTLTRFLDVFHHRLLTLFYRAWAEAQPTVQHDRPHDDRFAAWLGAGCGLDRALPAAAHLSEAARLFQAGLLGARSRHAEGLEKLLTQHFRVGVRVESNVAHWLGIERADQSWLGRSARVSRVVGAADAGARLGHGATAGHKVRDRQSRFRIALGPLTLAQYRAFLPGGPAWFELCDWVHQYTGLDLRWDVQLALARAEIPAPRLGRRGQVALGVSTWIGTVERRPGATAAPCAERHDLRLRPDTSFLLRLRRPLAGFQGATPAP